MRNYREMPEETKAKISQALKGRCKSITHKERISAGLKNYWQTIPNKPLNSDENEEHDLWTPN